MVKKRLIFDRLQVSEKVRNLSNLGLLGVQMVAKHYVSLDA